MKKLLLILLPLAFAPRLARAQEVAAPVAAETVTYSRDVPKGLRAFVPRGGKSRFWGATKLKYNGQQAWVHVYDVRKTRFFRQPINAIGQQDSGLDLFVFLKGSRLKLISSTRFSCARYATVGVDALWLDPKNRKVPVIDLVFNEGNGLYGPFTRHGICVFKGGVGKKAIVDLRFGDGADNGSGWNSWDTEFAVMLNGLVGIIYNQSRGESRSTYFRWETNQFKAFKRLLLNRDEPEKSIEVPFDTPLNSGSAGDCSLDSALKIPQQQKCAA